jgi:hypothetical protein
MLDFRRGPTSHDEDDDGSLESPSKVLGGSTSNVSWTGGIGHGCTAVFHKDKGAG